jgi:hypothetical protein
VFLCVVNLEEGGDGGAWSVVVEEINKLIN